MLDPENRLDEAWQKPLGNSQCCTRYVGRQLLPAALGMLIVLAMDEVERLFDTDSKDIALESVSFYS